MDTFSTNKFEQNKMRKVMEPIQETGLIIEIPVPIIETLLDRFCIYSNAFDALSLANAASAITSQIVSGLRLINTQFKEGLNHRLDDDTIYYALHSVNLGIKDLEASSLAYKKIWKMVIKKNTTEGHKTFCNIYLAIERVKGVMALLSDQFSEDDKEHSSNEQIRGVLETVKKEVEFIRDELVSFHSNRKQKQQA